jgi:hypothetical protein
MEPLMGPVDLTAIGGSLRAGYQSMDALRGTAEGWPGSSGFGGRAGMGGRPRVDWVITGGETDQGGHKARPSHPNWFRGIRDACAAAGVPYHHKQNGEWSADGRVEEMKEFYRPTAAWPDGTVGDGDHLKNGGPGRPLWRVGKKRAGRLLDGVEHNAIPVLP